MEWKWNETFEWNWDEAMIYVTPGMKLEDGTKNGLGRSGKNLG